MQIVQITCFDWALCSQTDSLNKSLKPSFPNSYTISTKQLCGKSPICSCQFRSFGQHRQKVLLMVILYPCILLQTWWAFLICVFAMESWRWYHRRLWFNQQRYNHWISLNLMHWPQANYTNSKDLKVPLWRLIWVKIN